MAERLKDMFFTSESVDRMADAICKFYPEFNKQEFVNLVFDDTFKDRELKDMMRHTTICLHKTLSMDYEGALDLLKKAAPLVKGFEAMSLPDYVELYGTEYLEISLQALLHFTKYSSSEFAIRPFLDREPEKVMDFMGKCAEDEHENVRRFASEGCRPRLPWAMALPKFKKNPDRFYIENLKLSADIISIGDEIHFTFDLIVAEKKESKIRLEYAVYYVKANGKLSKKIFQIIEKSYMPGKYSLRRKQSFIDMTTRKHYPGEHQISVIVNGEEKIVTSIEIVK